MQTHLSLSQYEARCEGKNIFLRTLQPDDASEEYASWLGDPVVNQYLETRSVTAAELRTYVQEKYESDETLFFGIFWKQDGKHIGNIKLESIDFDKGSAGIGILVGDQQYWGKGVATEATNLLTTYAFETLGLREIYLGVIETNTPAVHVYEKCGFVRYGVEKDRSNVDGVPFDYILMRKCYPVAIHE